MQEVIDASLAQLREYPALVRALLADLRVKNDTGGRIEPWKEDQLNRFGILLAQNATELERAFAEGNEYKTAWVARNILELSVWVRYCNLSEAHGKRFRVDGARDLIGFYEAYAKLHFDKIKSELPKIDKATQEMESAIKAEFGVTTVGTAYERVAKAAADVGERKFETLNKIFSKFAHPTAWVVASLPWGDFENFKAMFLIEGTMQANVALDEIRMFVLRHYPMSAGAIKPRR